MRACYQLLVRIPLAADLKVSFGAKGRILTILTIFRRALSHEGNERENQGCVYNTTRAE
jgi:hypothetical protein